MHADLKLIRTDLRPHKTFGLLDLNGAFFCHTLEDEDRHLETNPAAKRYGETAIPRGKFVVVLDFSARFKRRMPHVLGVPHFDGIRIHPGNTPADTHGCILVGDLRDANGIAPGTSGLAYERLLKRLSEATSISLEVL